MAPWLEGAPRSSLSTLPPDGRAGAGRDEQRRREALVELAREGLDAATDPSSADFMDFHSDSQPLVDAAFLAQALLRAPNALWDPLPARVKANVVAALRSSRSITPPENNWVLFAAVIEAFFRRVGETADEARLYSGLRRMRSWYVGDAWYSDGPEFNWNYYNAFVIHPLLIDILDVVGDEAPEWHDFRAAERRRLTRFAAIEERLIAPDGTYPLIGRSLTYRCGAFQALALAALRQSLPDSLPPPQARRALTAVIRRTLTVRGTFDANGFLRIGVSGHQPSLGESYISTGSLYLCSDAFLPLGLPPSAPFWTNPDEPTTWEKAWSGRDLPSDEAIKG